MVREIIGALGTLAMAIFAVLEHRRKRPQLAVQDEGQVTGRFRENGHTGAHICLILTLTAKSETPVIPSEFKFRVENGNSWLQFLSQPIPHGLSLGSEMQEIDLGKPWERDLQRFSGAIRSDCPVRGYLLFVSHGISADRLNELCRTAARAELTCIDVHGKRHTHKFRLASELADERVDPKHGFSVKSKAPPSQR